MTPADCTLFFSEPHRNDMETITHPFPFLGFVYSFRTGNPSSPGCTSGLLPGPMIHTVAYLGNCGAHPSLAHTLAQLPALHGPADCLGGSPPSVTSHGR